jgi:hypothetical protein
LETQSQLFLDKLLRNGHDIVQSGQRMHSNHTDIGKRMTRNRGQRSFTVIAKSSSHHGFVTIPAKAPWTPQTTARTPMAAAASVVPSSDVRASAPVDARRVLPSLIAWEPPSLEPAPVLEPEPPLPRVRRMPVPGTIEDAPRRRGRPRKHPLPVEMPAAVIPPAVARQPEPAPVVAAPRAEPLKAAPRRERPDGSGLRLGERWKRRLPRSCW